MIYTSGLNIFKAQLHSTLLCSFVEDLNELVAAIGIHAVNADAADLDAVTVAALRQEARNDVFGVHGIQENTLFPSFHVDIGENNTLLPSSSLK